MAKEIVLSGIRPTGFLHLGNYFGAVKNWVRMQEEYDCYFCVVDWHSLTTHPDTSGLRENVHRQQRSAGANKAYCRDRTILKLAQRFAHLP